MLEPNATLDRRPALPRYSNAEHDCKRGHACMCPRLDGAANLWCPPADMEENKNATDTWTDCNASDMDLCELDGQTWLFWTWGHQSQNGGLVLGLSPMPLAEFLAAWF